MVKRTIKETIREYDSDGRLLRETITETNEDDDAVYYPQSSFSTVCLDAGKPIPCN